MSLQSLALMIAATGALRETLPELARVVMDPFDALALAYEGERVIVAVFVGDEITNVVRRHWSDGDTVIELAVQVLLPPRIVAVAGGASCVFDAKSGGARAVFALIHEGLRRAFSVPGPGTWRELLQAVWIGHPESLSGMPGKAEALNRPAVPVLDYSIPCAVIGPPPPGETPPSPWPDIVAKMRSDPLFSATETDYFEALVAGQPLTDEQAELALAGLSRPDAQALGYGTLGGLDAPPDVSQVTVETGRGSFVVGTEP